MSKSNQATAQILHVGNAGHVARFASIFTHFGKVSTEDAEDHVGNIAAGGGVFDADPHDKDSLRIGGVLVRESLGADLLERVASVCSLESSCRTSRRMELCQTHKLPKAFC